MRTEPLPIVGVELGARLEKAAVSVTDRAYVSTGEAFNASRYDHRLGCQRLHAREKVSVEYRVRHLERYSPLVRYKGVAERVAELVRAVGDCDVILDLTCTGRPVHTLVVRAVNEALKETGACAAQCPITVTGEFGAVSRSPDVGWMVPRRDLVSSALLLFEQEELKIAEGLTLAETLTSEFAEFKPRAPKEELEGWRLGRNDDLVLAVATSVWAAERFLRKEDSVPVGALGAA